MEWSFDSTFLATKCESIPTVVWIWEVNTLELHTVLIHMNQVKSIKFAPNAHQLIIGTGQPRVFAWTPAGSCVIPLPHYMDVASGLHVQKIKWNPRSSNLVFSDKQFAILGFPSAELMGGGGFTEVKRMNGQVTSSSRMPF
jgi:hypothetical protein